MVGQAVEVLLGLVLIVELPLDVEEAVTVAVVECDLVPRAEAESVGVDDPVLEDVAVLEIEEDPVIVLELVIEEVRVNVVLIVPDTKGERDADADAVGVFDGRTEAVPEPEPDDVFDGGGDLV